MDEVDFTILAATSVLGDLIEKCPPAEACRDAFDRMSKATVQMCMSTTGFSSSAQGLNSRQQLRQPQTQAQSQAQAQAHIDYFSESSSPATTVNLRRPASTRPKPQFDMGLNDLFPPASPPLSNQKKLPPAWQRPTSQNSAITGVKPEFESPYSASATSQNRQAAGPQLPAQQKPSPSEYAISPPLSSLDANIDPALLPQSYVPGFDPNFDLFLQNAPGMDFLNQSNGETVAGDAMGDWGVGLGWDGGMTEGGGHDYSEGGNGNVDLFEGFFFGGAGNY